MKTLHRGYRSGQNTSYLAIDPDSIWHTKGKGTARTFGVTSVFLAILTSQGCLEPPLPSSPRTTVAGIPAEETPTLSFQPNQSGWDEREAAEILEQLGAEIEWNAAGHVSSLNLYWTEFKDEDLPKLFIFTELETLLLPSLTSDEGLAHLRGLTQLKILFPPNGITDVGLMQIRHLKNLRELHMYGSTKITDNGLESLRGLSHLEYVGLQHTELTGAGVAHLQTLPNLHWLSLAYTKISDAELRNFEGMHQLRGLSLFGAKISEKGVSRLQQQLPDCVVMYR